MNKNKYSRRINGRKYCVHVFECRWWSIVAIRDRYYNSPSATTYAKRRKWFCDDVDRLAANTLSKAVQNREDRIEKSNEYDNRINRALDVVEETYEE